MEEEATESGILITLAGHCASAATGRRRKAVPTTARAASPAPRMARHCRAMTRRGTTSHTSCGFSMGTPRSRPASNGRLASIRRMDSTNPRRKRESI
jgi:hypothetical protein